MNYELYREIKRRAAKTNYTLTKAIFETMHKSSWTPWMQGVSAKNWRNRYDRARKLFMRFDKAGVHKTDVKYSQNLQSAKSVI